MIRRFLRAAIQNASVTHVDPDWPVSLRIDPILLRAIDVLPLEEVEIVSLSTGERFTTFAAEGKEGSGEVRVHAGERHHVRAGDVVSILSWGQLHDGQTLAHRAKLVTVDGQNRIVALLES